MNIALQAKNDIALQAKRPHANQTTATEEMMQASPILPLVLSPVW